MVGDIDPEAALVNGEGDGFDRRRALSENVINPAGPPTAIPREVGDPVAKLMTAKAKDCGWMAPARGVRPVPKTLAMGSCRFVRGDLPRAVEIARKDSKMMWLGAVRVTNFVNASLNVIFGSKTRPSLLECEMLEGRGSKEALPKTALKIVGGRPVCPDDLHAQARFLAGYGNGAQDPQAGRVRGEIVGVDPQRVIGEKHLTTHFDMVGFLQLGGGANATAFHIEELGLTAKSFSQLLTKPPDLGLGTASVLKNHDPNFANVHEGQNFFKFFSVDAIHIECGNNDITTATGFTNVYARKREGGG